MHLICYDCRDAAPGSQHYTMRLVEDDGTMCRLLMQAQCFGDHPEALAERLATALGADLRVIGPDAHDQPNPDATHTAMARQRDLFDGM